MTLSDNIWIEGVFCDYAVIKVEDVREFIKNIRNEIFMNPEDDPIAIIDKLAGSELVGK